MAQHVQNQHGLVVGGSSQPHFFMTLRFKLCSLRFNNLEGIRKDDGRLVEPSIQQVALFDQVEISQVIHLDGLVLAVTKDNSKLFLWNPSLEQTRCIVPRTRTNFRGYYNYSLGYDINHNYKILRGFNEHWSGTTVTQSEYEIYHFSSNSWTTVVDFSCDCSILEHQRGVTLKGNTYFFAFGVTGEASLLCFDFTRERFGQELDLPFYPQGVSDTMTLSCLREEQLAALFQEDELFECFQIWVTNKIEPNQVSWSKFLVVDDMNLKFCMYAASFFIDEDEKVAVVFDTDVDSSGSTTTGVKPTAYIIGEDRYFKSVSLGDGYLSSDMFCTPLVSSSYVPSLVQIHKRERGLPSSAARICGEDQ